MKNWFSKLRKRDLCVLVGIIAILVGVLLGYFLVPGALNSTGVNGSVNVAQTNLSLTALANKTEQYVTANFLSQYGAMAKVKSYMEKEDIVIFELDIIQNNTVASTGEVYVTKDGNFLILGGIYDLNTALNLSQQDTTQQPSQQTIPKTAKPSVKLFVMAFCPYGQEAEGVMWPVLSLLGDKIDFELHFVVYPTTYYTGQEQQYCLGDYCSMHGVSELREDVRQTCIIKNYDRSVWMQYIAAIDSNCSYSNVDTCWKPIADSFGIDSAKIESCVNQSALSIAGTEKSIVDTLGVQGSPTLFINGVEYSGGRTADGYKSAICDAFTSAPVECSQSLSTAAGTASGSCG